MGPRLKVWFIEIVNLTQCRVPRKESLTEELSRLGWLCWIVLTKLIDVGRPSLKVDSSVPKGLGP